MASNNLQASTMSKSAMPLDDILQILDKSLSKGLYYKGQLKQPRPLQQWDSLPFENCLALLHEMGMPIDSRLTYLPAVPQHTRVKAVCYIDCWDRSLEFLLKNGLNTIQGNEIVLPLPPKFMENHFDFFLTKLDAISCIPKEHRSPELKESSNWLDLAQERMRPAMRYKVGDLDERFRNCHRWLFMRRLAFYLYRRAGSSDVKDLHNEVSEMTAIFQGPDDWDIHGELEKLKSEVLAQLAAVDARFGEAVALEPVDGHVSVESFTNPVEGSIGVTLDCVICRAPITTPGVETHCRHIYCKECLETWTQACQRASHMCPYCRTEMFPAPKYRPTAEAENYYQAREPLQEHLAVITDLGRSSDLLEMELKMEKEICEARAGSVISFGECDSSSGSEAEADGPDE